MTTKDIEQAEEVLKRIEKLLEWSETMDVDYQYKCLPLISKEVIKIKTKRIFYEFQSIIEKAEKARQLIDYWQTRALTAEEKYDKLFEGLKVEERGKMK